ncbi:hypothetical protein JCM19235_6576 [Vibrio maritimus]|uniref:Uncharacterized protein n=1 Tax=Vibrio maritimus TaxID=990268 RepID=A0A090RU15_9VIBR|nr:hypothetical protein JCM19235_6576 [Vibrio maritimus]
MPSIVLWSAFEVNGTNARDDNANVITFFIIASFTFGLL